MSNEELKRVKNAARLFRKGKHEAEGQQTIDKTLGEILRGFTEEMLTAYLQLTGFFD